MWEPATQIQCREFEVSPLALPGVGANTRHHATPVAAPEQRKTLMNELLWWILVVAMMATGLAGTVLPALPGTLLIFGAAVLGGWIDNFTRVGTTTLVILGVLALLAWVLDYVAGLLGAKKAGASRYALIGAALGTVAGIFMGLVGVLFMPLVGAAAGEYLALQRGVSALASADQSKRALQVGVATWLGIMAGLAAKVVIACTMVGIFVVALLL
jgi:uncharacterized protein